ncbi:hypothetical protein ACFQZU_18860, partial [Streptomonospora algeriensis]
AGEPWQADQHGSGQSGAQAESGAGSRSSSDSRSDSPGLRARDDSIDLLSTVGLPVLKRALPAIGAVALVATVFILLRRRKTATTNEAGDAERLHSGWRRVTGGHAERLRSGSRRAAGGHAERLHSVRWRAAGGQAERLHSVRRRASG